MEITTYVRSTNGKNIIIFKGDRDSFRCRQRSKNINGDKVIPLKFVSYKGMKKESKKWGKNIIGPNRFYTLSRL